MIRTLISLPREIKVWLDDYSKKKNKPTAETIREALKQYKEKVESEKVDSLEATAGIWKDKKLDANEYVDKLRSEW
ncbi:MAG TPA: hypothetical protein PK397_01615 [Ignavibacteriaceae bacterium]|nr:hypothetical protein [Ignavibacteriaceae bacterium]